jgi:hypothetical protein
MKNYIGHDEARSTTEFLELALGTPMDLWLGEEGESELERAARMDAARDIIADDPGLLDRTTRLAVETLRVSMPDLLRLAPLPGGISRRGKSYRAGAAA